MCGCGPEHGCAVHGCALQKCGRGWLRRAFDMSSPSERRPACNRTGAAATPDHVSHLAAATPGCFPRMHRRRLR
eukprot:361775-Chlamydomonas_euryale.AAC.4